MYSFEEAALNLLRRSVCMGKCAVRKPDHMLDYLEMQELVYDSATSYFAYCTEDLSGSVAAKMASVAIINIIFCTCAVE